VGLSSQRTALTQYFYDEWDEDNGVVAYPNKHFQTPNGEAFLVFNILTYFKERRSIGMDQWLTRRHGAVQIDIYVPEGTGIGSAREKADLVEAIFESTSVVTADSETIRFRTPGTADVSINERRASNTEDSYFRLIVTCPYYVDEVKSS
jgi:hypothetical protein